MKMWEMRSPDSTLRDGARPRVVFQRVSCSQEPHGVIARGETELQRRLVEARGQGMVRELGRSTVVGPCGLQRTTMKYTSPRLTGIRIDDVADLVVREQIRAAA